MSVTYSEANSFVFSSLDNPEAVRNGWHSRCPFCHDSKKSKHKKRFWIKFESPEAIFWHCFNCDASGTFYDLFAHVKGISPKEAYEQFRQFDNEKIRKRLIREEEALPEASKPISEGHMNWILQDCVGSAPEGLIQTQLVKLLNQFREERKIHTDYPLYVASRGRYGKRYIIPVVENGDILYFQGRAIVGTMDPKYLNPSVEKSKIILNKNYFNRNLNIIVTEGLIDAMSVEDHQGTSCLGASVQDEFLDELTKYTDCNIIVALDNDETGYKKLNKFLEESKFSSDVRYFIMPKGYGHCKDLNDVKTKTDVTDIYSFVVTNSFEKFGAVVRLRMMKKT